MGLCSVEARACARITRAVCNAALPRPRPFHLVQHKGLKKAKEVRTQLLDIMQTLKVPVLSCSNDWDVVRKVCAGSGAGCWGCGVVWCGVVWCGGAVWGQCSVG